MAERSAARVLRRKQRIRRRLMSGVAVCAVAGAGIASWQVARAVGPDYRLAPVSRADVAQTVDAGSTVHIANQVALTFATSGTVAAVLAKQGTHVAAGQVVARLDPTSLENAVTSATQQLAQAKQTLADDEASQSSTEAAAVVRMPAIVLAAAVTRPSAAPSGAPSGGSSGTSSGTSGVAAVKAAQRALVAAVRNLDAALDKQDQDLATAADACSATADGEALTVATSSDSSGAVTGSIGDHAATVTLLSGSSTVGTQSVPAGGRYSFTGLTPSTSYQLRIVSADKVIDTANCTRAMAAVSADKTATDHASSTLDSSMPPLTSAVSALRSAGSGASGSSSSSSGTGSGGSSSGYPGGGNSGGNSGSKSSGSTGSSGFAGSTGNSGSTSSGAGGYGGSTGGSTSGGTSGSPSTRVITAAQIVADQKAIDSARAQLQLARRNRGFAALTAPISGTVADVAVTSGQSVGTSTTALTVVGSNHKQVTVDIGIDRIDLVKVGQHAAVTLDGRTAPLSGTVTRVGMLNTASSGATSTYAVTVDLGPGADTVHDGTGASVAITVGTARHVLTVPLSAVHTVGSLHTVQVYSGGRVTTTPVTLGVVGSDRVQVLHGLTDNERVVLADVTAAVPSSTTDSRFGAGFGSGLRSELTGGRSVGRFGGVGGGFGGFRPGG